MRVASWNCNSVRARTKQLLAWLEAFRPDALCLQELKCVDEQFPHQELSSVGYRAVTHGQKAYNGVAIVSREVATAVQRGFGDGGDEAQARVLSATVGGVRLFSVYAPNGQATDSPAYGYKLDWYRRLRACLDAHHQREEPLVVAGDFNVAPAAIDVYDPRRFEGMVMCTPRERAALEELLAFGLLDVFRAQHPEGERYSWWDYRARAFEKNQGLRIDLVLATEPLYRGCARSDIDRVARGADEPSDHAPVWADFS